MHMMYQHHFLLSSIEFRNCCIMSWNLNNNLCLNYFRFWDNFVLKKERVAQIYVYQHPNWSGKNWNNTKVFLLHCILNISWISHTITHSFASHFVTRILLMISIKIMFFGFILVLVPLFGSKYIWNFIKVYNWVRNMILLTHNDIFAHPKINSSKVWKYK